MRTAKKPREPNAFRKFRLLMWKNFLQQWRHRIQTAMELLLPVLTTTLVLILRWQIEPVARDTITYPSIPAYTLNHSTTVLMGMNLTELSIAYSPTSPELEDVVRSAFANMIMHNARELAPILEEIVPGLPDLIEGGDFPDISNITWPPSFPNITLPPAFENITWPSEIGNITLPPDFDLNNTIYELIKSAINVTSYNNSQELRVVYRTEELTRSVIVAVEFSDALYGATELPYNLSYALRFPERPRLNSFFSLGGRSWRTDEVFPAFEFPGPRFPSSWEGGNDPGYVNEMFVALQHSISTELIARFTGEDDVKRFNVNIQRYPHPPYLEDLAVEALQFLFPSFIMLSFSYTAVNIARAVTVEKELQLKETMKIMGLPTWLHWTAWFFKQFIYLLIAAFLIVMLIKVNWFSNEDGFGEYAVFTNTPWTILLFFMVLYLACTIFFCFMLSSLFSKGSTAALFTGVIWMLSYIPAFLLAMDTNVSLELQIFTCLSLNCAMSYGFQILLGRESTGGMQWSDFMANPATDSTRFVFGHVIIMLVVDCVLYMLIALYLEQVMPGPFGMPQKWYFPVQKSFWFPSSNNSKVTLENGQNDEVIKEKDPTDHTVGVEIKELTKVFDKNVAVNGLSLNIYDDQITVLLGHNGAGKSTTMAMLTGNLQATRGSVNLAGYDVASQVSAARAHLGFCPQHNVLFNELTVREHLEFFARLKGFTGKDLNYEIDELIEKLELQEKRDYQSQGLSGGQKRRLCVGIALSSAARVVLLDEPTSGMDPASRRALWDLLQREKKGRSMILTTHFMDEADILGDRVAIMANGKLQCVGSPFFLKRHYGVGYTLVVVKDVDFNYEACTKLIEKYIPGTTIKEDRVSELTYTLTNGHSDKFETMLTELENSADIIKFKNYGLVSTTLEDVFMSVGSDVAVVNSVSDDGAGTSDVSSDDVLRNELCDSLDQLSKDAETVTGWRLILQHVRAIWLKLLLVWTRSWWLIVLQLAIPILLVNASLYILEFLITFVRTMQVRPLSLEVGYTRTETFLSYNGTEGLNSGTFGAIAKQAYEFIFNTSSVATMELTTVDNITIDQYYLSRGDDPYSMGSMRHRVLIGATFDDNSATAWFSNFGYHDVATSLATIHSALLKALNSTAFINVYNHPLEATYQDQNDMQTMVAMLSMQLSNGVGSSLGIASAVYIMFYIKERASGAKLLQKAAGVQPIVLWGSAAVFDWFSFLIVCVVFVVSYTIFQVIGLSTAAELGNMYLCLMVYGAAMLPFVYIMSHVFTGPAMGFVTMFFINVLVGMMGAQIVEALSAPQLDTEEVANILDAILQFFPLYSLVTSIRKLNQIGLVEYTCLQGCSYISAIMPNIEVCTMEVMCEYFSENCCVRENPHLEWEDPGVLRYLVAMLGTTVVLWLVLMFIEYRIYYKIFAFKKTPPPLDESELNKDVIDEAKHVQLINKSNLKDHGLVAKDLSKYYGKNLAVDQVSFSVSDTECFGLLGVNGAGKTTTFKMLMGDETISSGEAHVSGYSVQRQLTKVHQNIGYCPQFDALFGELTGRETLRVFSLFRGLPSDVTSPRAELLAQSLGFLKHLDKRVDQYSGGTKRKLNTALSFLGQTRLIFMDEPTTGVDPAAKRHVWRAVRGIQRSGRGVVLTSHSMEECEALCSRLTIMVNGRFQCLGTPQHLKNIFSQGFTLNIKLRIPDDASEETKKSIAENVKVYVTSNFNTPRVMEEYQGLLTYYLPDRSLPWSRMFGIMEEAKRDLEIEDYNISQTTLEQIFLQFTKYQKEGL